MEKETMMSDKDLSWFLGVEDETENESTSQEATAVPERDRPTNKQNTENSMHSESARNAENVTIQKRISAKMRKKTLEAYKQAYLVPTKLNNRKAVYLSRETQERADFIVRRLGDRGSNLSSFVENIVRQHLEEYGEDIGGMEKIVNHKEKVDGFLEKGLPFLQNRSTFSSK